VALSGLAVAVVGLAGFGLAHAILIVPIWTRLLGGVPFAAGAGLALAWAFDVLYRDRGSQSIASGVQFGAVMFLTQIPATALDTILRLSGFRRDDWPEVVAALMLAMLSGGAAGWAMTRRRDASLAFAVAALALMLVSAGPLPVAQSARGAWLSLAIAPICLVCGAALSVVRGVLGPRSDSGGQASPE
jgi:hypothetical protein